ncbi:hypothetical protein G6F37_008607 [Rhizopus arrhizus]|nr:hypothetical protein G6F38_009489 [Rhizopus arrhizus]KAG1155360.1 hypothetical protein G6F37_008607 [Rhizopus arrhizus]
MGTLFNRSNYRLYVLLASILTSSILYQKLSNAIFVPKQLQHIPKVNTLQWFWSVLIGESHDVRVKRLVLPIMNKYGLCLKYVMGNWTLTVADPHYLQMLLKDVKSFPKIQVAMDPDLILTNQAPSLSNCSMDDWKRQRSIANPIFQRAMPVETFGNVVLKLFRSVDTLNQDGVIDIADYAKRYALDCLGLGLFDFDMAAVSNPESYYSTLYKEAFSIVRDPLVYLFPAYTRIPSKWIPYRNRAQVANERLRKIFYEVIEEKKAAPSTSSDLLSLMIKANHSESDIAYLTDDELISNLSTFFVAGHETTASAIASFFYYLAAHPDIQKKARKEVLLILGDDPDDILPTDKQLKQMTFLNYCIKETMRINPPTSGNLPRMTSRVILIGNFLIPKDTIVHLELYCAHHLEKYWDRPQEFIPKRFDTASKNYRENAVWMPFGYGPRTCIGLNFSLSEQRVLLAMMLKKFCWKLVPNSEHQHGLRNAHGGGIGLLGPESLKIQLIKRYA